MKDPSDHACTSSGVSAWDLIRLLRKAERELERYSLKNVEVLHAKQHKPHWIVSGIQLAIANLHEVTEQQRESVKKALYQTVCVADRAKTDDNPDDYPNDDSLVSQLDVIDDWIALTQHRLELQHQLVDVLRSNDVDGKSGEWITFNRPT